MDVPAKDYEHTFTALTSRHGGRVHGLNTNPNLSFINTLPLPPDFTAFRNHRHHSGRHHHNAAAAGVAASRAAPGGGDERHGDERHVDERWQSAPQVFVTLVQTDGLGLGAWAKSGRGSLPYSWEVTLPDLELQPALLAMFYSQATPNDTFGTR